MSKKWINVGDYNPRESGGVFVRRVDDCMKVVTINPIEEIAAERQQYILNSADFDIDVIIGHYENKTGPYGYADWEHVLSNRVGGIMDNLEIMASDMMSYYGGDHEDCIDTNFWRMLKTFGVTRNNFN